MTNRQAATLAYKLMGIYVVTQVIAAMGVAPYFALSGEVGAGPIFIVAFLPFCVLLLLASVLFFCSDWLAEKTFPHDEAAARPRTMDTGEWMSLACAAIGVLLISSAVPTLFSTAWYLFLEDGLAELFHAGRWSGLAGNLVELALGLGLFFGSVSFSKWWHQAREVSREGNLSAAAVWVIWGVMFVLAILMLISFTRRPA